LDNARDTYLSRFDSQTTMVDLRTGGWFAKTNFRGADRADTIALYRWPHIVNASQNAVRYNASRRRPMLEVSGK